MTRQLSVTGLHFALQRLHDEETILQIHEVLSQAVSTLVRHILYKIIGVVVVMFVLTHRTYSDALFSAEKNLLLVVNVAGECRHRRDGLELHGRYRLR